MTACRNRRQPDVEVLPAGVKEKPLLASMLESCLRELGASLQYPYFEDYWSEPTRYPFVISAAGRMAGFALVRRLNPSDQLEMAEFYVLPEYRRLGVGRAGARALFAQFPSKWRIAVLRSNAPGALFWSRVVPCTMLSRIEDDTMVFSFSAETLERHP